MTRRYSLLAAVSAVPLLIVIVVLTLYQFTRERQQLLDELEEQAIGHNILLGHVIKSVQDHVRTLAAWGEIYWRESDPTRPVPAPSNAYTIADGGLVVRGDGFAGRADAGREARLAGNLSRHMRLSHQEMPYLRWSYYLSAGADLMSVVPFSRRQSFGGELSQAPPAQVLERFRDHAILTLAKAGARVCRLQDRKSVVEGARVA